MFGIVKVWFCTTDSGGGGTGDSMGKALTEFKVLEKDGFVADCTLHDINLEMTVPVRHTLMGIRVSKDDILRNVDQMIYASFAWEKELGREMMRETWQEYTGWALSTWDDENDRPETLEYIEEKGEKFIAMPRGSQSRWWSVGEAACILWNTKAMRWEIARNFDDMKPCPDKKAQKICQTFLSLIKEPVLRCDLALLRAYHRFYLARHMVFFQAADPLTKKAGFGSLNVFVRCFLMREDYAKMQSYFGTNPPDDMDEFFTDLVATFNNIPVVDRTIQTKKIQKIFEIAEKEHRKMFDRKWVKGELNFLSAFAKFETGRLVCQRLLGLPLSRGDDNQQFFFSTVHKRLIDLDAFSRFVGENISVSLDHPHMCIKISSCLERLQTKVSTCGTVTWSPHRMTE